MNKEYKDWCKEFEPISLKDVVGQDKTVKELIKRFNEGSLRQNMLLSGSTGVGKTVIGKIIAMQLNCNSKKYQKIGDLEYKEACGECDICQKIISEESNQYFHFFDGAKLNKDGIDRLEEMCQFNPMGNHCRIIFIDEIQNIAGGRDRTMQSLLKFLDKDYKGKVYFITATMELNKIQKAVIDRFKPHFRLKDLKPDHFVEIAQKILLKKGLLEEVNYTTVEHATDGIPLFVKEGLKVIVTHSNGSARELINHLETCVYRELYSKQQILEELEFIDEESIILTLEYLLNKNISEAYKELSNFGQNVEAFYKESFTLLVHLSKYVYTKEPPYVALKSSLDRLSRCDQKNLKPLLDLYMKMSEYPYFAKNVFYSNLYSYFHRLAPEAKQSTETTARRPRPK